MPQDSASVLTLVDEYKTLFRDLRYRNNAEVREHDLELVSVLVSQSEWTPNAASALIELSRSYGAFILRNALAVSLALGIEDGELGY